jgi:hypothetical protein
MAKNPKPLRKIAKKLNISNYLLNKYTFLQYSIIKVNEVNQFNDDSRKIIDEQFGVVNDS